METPRQLSAPPPPGDGASLPGGGRPAALRPAPLRPIACAFALLVFGLWLVIFAGGILVDTRPYRLAISAGGVAALEAPADEAVVSPTPGRLPGRFESWAVVLLWFLPVNLALLCAVSGLLGAFGSRANLQDDLSAATSQDSSNPYLSALLRGFFVYLVMISGLLLLDDAPFANPTPGQYIRLAGFLSLFSFLVNYHPHVFGRLLLWAADRIQARGENHPKQGGTETDIRVARATTVEVATLHASTEHPDEPPPLPPAAAELQPAINRAGTPS